MDEKKLVKEIQRKNEAALIYFIDNYAGLMKSVINRILWDYDYIIEDVLSESVLKVWKNISDYSPKISSFKNWCASIARYQAIDTLRKEIRHKSSSLEEIDDYIIENNLSKLVIEEVLNHLSTEDKEIFKLLFLDGESYNYISEKTGIPKDTLYNRVHRGKKKLKNIYKGDFNG